jgi:hypothetical protein
MTKEEIEVHPAWTMLAGLKSNTSRYHVIMAHKSDIEEKFDVTIELRLHADLPNIPDTALTLSVEKTGQCLVAVFLTKQSLQKQKT